MKINPTQSMNQVLAITGQTEQQYNEHVMYFGRLYCLTWCRQYFNETNARKMAEVICKSEALEYWLFWKNTVWLANQKLINEHNKLDLKGDRHSFFKMTWVISLRPERIKVQPPASFTRRIAKLLQTSTKQLQ